MKISENFKIVPLVESANVGSSGVDTDSVDMGKLHSFCAMFEFGAITGNSILKVYAGATAGTKTTALAFKYRFGNGDTKAASADVLGAWTDVASTGLTLTAATFDHRVVVVEVESSEMPDAKQWLTLEIDATATTMNVAAIGVGDQRYDNSVTVI